MRKRIALSSSSLSLLSSSSSSLNTLLMLRCRAMALATEDGSFSTSFWLNTKRYRFASFSIDGKKSV